MLTFVCLVFKEQFLARRPEATLSIYHAAFILSTPFFKTVSCDFFVVRSDGYKYNKYFNKGQ
jgi:hypothetical protein